jgi:hypothetical protein
MVHQARDRLRVPCPANTLNIPSPRHCIQFYNLHREGANAKMIRLETARSDLFTSSFAATEDEYKFETTVTSLTGPDQPYAYVDQDCSDNSISCSRNFVCAVFSLYQPDIQWYFQPCPDQTCQFELVSNEDYKK